MLKKALTHMIIMTLAVMPVQLISASVESSVEKTKMQMSMMNSMQMDNECVEALTHNVSKVQIEQNSTDKSCCDDQSHQCQSCNNCPQAASAAMFLLSHQNTKAMLVSAQNNAANYLVLSGIPQQNILKPPRTFI